MVQMVVLGRWRATGDDLYRELVHLVEPAPGKEILISGCGDGVTAEWLARRTGAAVTGVDPSPERIARAEEKRRAFAIPQPLTYQQAELDDLPHENEVFDGTIGEPVLASATDPARAVAELVRVTKPMGPVVLLQPTWSSDIATGARELLVERLGLRPHLLVEWKQMLREAGVVDIQVQDWTSGGPGTATTRGTGARTPIGPQLTWRQKIQIAGRAWRRWGWREARGAIEQETTLLRELARERSIGFQLIKGVKWPHARAS
jgi:SAM-dependent methyltransferase